MSKKSKQGKKRKSIPKIGNSKPKKNVLNLKSVLQSVYHDYANMETNCKHLCECCNVAMPQMNYCEFVQIVTVLWNGIEKDEKINLICKSVEYFFKNEYLKWQKDSLIKPCMLLDKEGLCKIYEDRPLNCRLYGLWPKEDYEKRVDRFAEIYAQYGLKKEDLPLNTQCPNVKRVDDKVPLTSEVINSLFGKLDELDKSIGGFTSLQTSQKENYRTFHDWLLLKIYGEKWLVMLTTFSLAATKEQMEDQINELNKAIRAAFIYAELPDLSRSF